jgi:hypothetical protein
LKLERVGDGKLGKGDILVFGITGEVHGGAGLEVEGF